ncbi:hypothetical protein NDA14_003030 [Ustilago hordei]|uniref:Uncharacterized protein n=1 Tax=Ustilago hordei TaxID=120017 RepID=I2FXE8_USTHO|nr:hypothetical protein NDA15_003265 [Ustilago hordei]KAJ1589773.1 hypothetical protein NDA12_000739 [Ustilago hordei]KAJ1602217.1 hypothetical protein NDA14_003030 [Ustilago hordei]UTT97014.1 hypothetical protein NDA17_004325 [Ustilago hordei]CCF51591.1 uncharacterized protein UHOR_08302 [Ustilago hordei]
MERTPYTTMAELIRQAALEEATTRAKTRSPLNTSPSAEASSSRSAAAELSTEAGAEIEELSAVYEDEKARNDALAKMLDKRIEALAQSTRLDTAKDNDQKKRELEWQQLEYAIQSLEKENQHAPPLDSSAVLDIRTRAELHDLNLQYASALEKLKVELASERDALLRETQLQSDLEIVQTGLEKRLAQLQRKKGQDLTSESAVRELNRKFKAQESRFKELLAQLIDMGNALFGSDNRKVVTLRHYLDEFMNQAWDKPLDPWVSAGKLALRRTGGEVDDAMIELFLRANVVVAHPKDSRKWRLVAFHKATRSS